MVSGEPQTTQTAYNIPLLPGLGMNAYLIGKICASERLPTMRSIVAEIQGGAASVDLMLHEACGACKRMFLTDKWQTFNLKAWQHM